MYTSLVDVANISPSLILRLLKAAETYQVVQAVGWLENRLPDFYERWRWWGKGWRARWWKELNLKLWYCININALSILFSLKKSWISNWIMRNLGPKCRLKWKILNDCPWCPFFCSSFSLICAFFCSSCSFNLRGPKAAAGRKSIRIFKTLRGTWRLETLEIRINNSMYACTPCVCVYIEIRISSWVIIRMSSLLWTTIN